jgi:hypothetical protein
MAASTPKRHSAKGNGSLFLFVRVLGAFILTITLTTGAARASSFVVMGEAAPASTPSIITLGSPTSTRLARTQARPSSWIDKSIEQLQQAYLRAKQTDRQPYPSVESLDSGGMETPSIIALGEPAPEITYEKVAAIPQKQRHGPMFKPLVIRGGVVGDAFAPASAGPSTDTSTSTQNTSSQAAASGGQSPSAPPPPVPAAPPPAVVPKGMPQ